MLPPPDYITEIYGLVVIGNGVAFTQVVKIKVPLFARMRYQYWVFKVKLVCVSVVTLAPTFVVVRP